MSAIGRQTSKAVVRFAVLLATVGSMLMSLGLASRANAGPEQFTVLDPTPQLLNGESAARRADILDRLQALGVDTMRIQVQWRVIAPSPGSDSEPEGFEAANPGDYETHGVEVLDSVVRGADARGIDVLLTPTSPIPDWATTSARRDGLTSPDVARFEQFVSALGRRYGGSCVPPRCAGEEPGGEPLPRVEQWAVWNEPNLQTFLRPQRDEAGHTVSGVLYRRLFLAAQRGLAASGHEEDMLLIGETAPSRGRVSTPPLKFLRQVFCLSAAYRATRDCDPLEASGWSHHPYNPHIPPWEEPRRTHRQIISIGSLGRLVGVLARVARAGASERRLPVYVTEYGIESYPQDDHGVSLQRQAEWVAIAEFLLYRNPWIRSFAQYLLDDDHDPSRELSFQTGLRFANGYPKPSYDAFPLTLVARPRQDDGVVDLWGHVRPGEGPYAVQIRFRDSNEGPGRLWRTVDASEDGYFRLAVPYRRGREWMATSLLTEGAVLEGAFVRPYDFPGWAATRR